MENPTCNDEVGAQTQKAQKGTQVSNRRRSPGLQHGDVTSTDTGTSSRVHGRALSEGTVTERVLVRGGGTGHLSPALRRLRYQQLRYHQPAEELH